jgi:hypothetical protein
LPTRSTRRFVGAIASPIGQLRQIAIGAARVADAAARRLGEKRN